METVNIVIGFLAGMFFMWAIAMRRKAEWNKDIESLKDFDTWKEWKNKSE